jgi:hypothetical protein
MRTDHYAKLSAICLCVVLFTSIIAPGRAQAQSASWTYMVYMSGDSSLSSYVNNDLDEMRLVGSDESLNILALADQSSQGDSFLCHVETSGLQRIQLAQVNAAWGTELNLGEPSTLVDFVKWSVSTYPAGHYVLDLWGHGTGWGGVCPDQGDFLEMTEVSTAMKAISAAGISLDIVSIDACQMGMLEVIYELRHAANYAITSEKDVPVEGWPYNSVLSILKNGPGMSAEDYGKGMIEAYMNRGMAHSAYSLTLSLIDLSQIGGVVNSLSQYSDEIIDMAGYFNPQIMQARGATEEYDGSYQYDLCHLLKNINKYTECDRLEFLAGSVMSSLSDCMVYERHWTNVQDEPAENASGLSIWFPMYSPTGQYEEIGLSQDTGWDEFLTEMSPYFSNPARVEESVEVIYLPVDSDHDGLIDTFEFGFQLESGEFNLEIYSSKMTLVHEYETSQPGWYNLSFSPETVDEYSAAMYLRNASGKLLNYTHSSMNKEALFVIYGLVSSNIGRGVKWMQVSVNDQTGKNLGVTTTDWTGHYKLELKVPTQTDGQNLTVSCGSGEQRQNISLSQLEENNIMNFQFENADELVLSIAYLAILINLVALGVLATWLYLSKKADKGEPEPPADKMPIN